ncbi:MAG: polysaccharide biosynthesis protein [Bacteroidales bacterium]|nr:polysaccharide biosynthesis protein [Bacteroidales bacterium]
MGWYFTKKALPYWFILMIDCVIGVISYFVTYWLIFRGAALQLAFWKLLNTAVLFTAVDVVFFRVFHTYSGILRYSSFIDLNRVLSSKLSAGAVIITLHFILNHHNEKFFLHLTTAQVVLSIFIAIIGMLAVRLAVRMSFDAIISENGKRAVVYGLQDGGVGIAKRIRNSKEFSFGGFITHDKSLSYANLLGEKVYQIDETLTNQLIEHHIKAVIVVPSKNEQFREDQKLQDMILAAGVKIYMVPNLEAWDKDRPSTNSLVEVKIEDLLPRKQIHVDLDSVKAELSEKKILITGSAGSIGSEIVRQVASFEPSEMVLIDQAETPQHDIKLMMQKEFPGQKVQVVVTSIDSKHRMEKVFESYKPDYVFHAAAYKHVPMMEDNPSTAVHNNIRGTRNIADLSVRYGVKKFVMISTDKAVNPTNVMGCSKRICEMYVQALNKAQQDGVVAGNTQFVTTRFGNVLGSNGSVIPIFKKQIAAGGPVTVTDPNIIRYFMLIPEACKLVLEAGAKGKGGEIFVFDMGDPVKIADLAKRMIALSGAKDVKIEYTGLRDGEKLYEEVLNEKESTKPSFHEKIRIAAVREQDYDKVKADIEELIEIANTYEPMNVVKKMKEIVPEYKSNNSVYSVLD